MMIFRHLLLCCVLSCVFILSAFAQDPLSLTRGAIPIRFELPYDGTASLGIYTPEGQLKRVLFQAVELPEGEHTVLWDGMDLWGKLIPAGTRLQVKVFSHQGIRAFYEFPLGYGDWHGEDPPWRTALTFPDRKDGEIMGPNGKAVAYRKDGVTYRMTKGMFDKDGNLTDKAKKAAYRHLIGDRVEIQPGEATLRGGWMSDHNPPKAIEVVVDRVFVSASGAEAGDPFIALNLEGRKIWGKGGAMGGKGPSRMWAISDEELLLLEGQRLSRLNSLDFSRSHFLTIKDPIQNIDVHGDRIHVIHKPRSAVKVEHFHKTLKDTAIQYLNTIPLHLSDEAGHMAISARDNFTQVFTGGSHALQGIQPTYRKGFGYFIIPLRSPGTVGSVSVGAFSKSGLNMEVYLLRSGLAYNPEEHSPMAGNRGKVADLGSLADMGDFGFGGEELQLDTSEFSGDWELFGSTDGQEALNWILAKDAPRETQAIMLKFPLPKGKLKGDVHLKHCVFWKERIQRANTPKLVVEATQLKKNSAPKQGRGWRLDTKEKIEPARPFQMLLNYGKPIRFDGFAMKQNRNHDFSIEAWRGEGPPALDAKEDWEEIHRFKLGPSHRTGYGTQKDNSLHFVSMPHRESTTALRLTYRSGLGRGKNGVNWKTSQPHRVAVQDFSPILLKDDSIEAAEEREPYDYVQYDLQSGKELSREVTFDAGFKDFVVHEDGQIFGTLNKGRNERPLVKSRLVDGSWEHSPFRPDDGPESYLALHSSRGRLLVAGGHRIFVMDPNTLETLHTLGWDQDYAPGPFDRNMVGRGGHDMALDDNNKLWFIESRRQPKRVARFNMAGECEWHITGGPGYGGFGTGYIDPDMENFYTNGLHYDLNYSEGSSDLIGFSDVPYAESSPIVVDTVFWYTNGGRVIHHENGHKYAVGYNSEFVALLKDGVMQPAMVSGSATVKGGTPSRFFTHKAWKEEWVGVDLKGKRYFWNDRNADGQFQKEEVILYKVDRENGVFPMVSGAYWGRKMGRDLAINTGSGRLAPRSFSKEGVPMYDMEDFQPFTATDLPSYSGLQAWGSRACSNPNPHNGASIVTDSGHRIMVGQPYVWDQNLQALGGAPDTEGGGDAFRPDVPGGKIQHPMGYAGVGSTRSEVGEVAAVIGNLGTWSLVSAKDRILLANLFDGRDGQFSTDLSGARGTEVTHRRFEGESYFGHFVTSTDGRHFVSAGKNYHALVRLEGLDEFKVTEHPLTITDQQYAKNQGLRKLFVQEWKEAQQARNAARWLVAKSTRERLGQDSPRLDGSVDAWGGIKTMHPIDARIKHTDPEPKYYFDVARSSKGLHLVYAGKNFQGSANDSIEGIFKNGFAFDFRWRKDPRARKQKDLHEGDRRIVFGKINGNWTAVFHDYVVPGADESEGRSYSSPVVTTRIDVVRELKPDEFQLKVQEETLMLEASTTQSLHVDDEDADADPRKWWTAEVVLPWKLLGINAPMYFDAGVMAANSGGTGVAERRYWATPQAVKTTSDLGAEAAIRPEKWGRMFYKPPEGAELEKVNSRWKKE